MTPRPRRALDRVLVDRGLARGLEAARKLVESGQVLVAGAPATSPSRAVASNEPVVVIERPRFVGRAGEKLDAALQAFGIEVRGGLGLDVGASTGGFTDCLLSRGVARVLAVDVGTNQLHERLGADDRVISLEQTNVQRLTREQVVSVLGAPPSIVTVDLSFTSVVGHLAHLVELASPAATMLVLVKPQFEVDRATASRGRGVVVDPAAWLAVIERAASAVERAGAGIMGVMASALRGASGNVEFFVHASPGAPLAGPAAITGLARTATAETPSP